MLVYRLARQKHGLNLSGKGAAIAGGRWNSIGVEIIYTAESRALAMAEVAVHLTLATLPDDYFMLTIEIPDECSSNQLDETTLPDGWHQHPPLTATQHIGDAFVHEQRACLLKVPSAVVKGDFNILINPHHTEFATIKILHSEPFPFDRRIIK